MCMYFDKDSQPVKGYMANEDIVCYKLLLCIDNEFVSPYYRHTKWNVGETKHSEVNVLKDEIVKVSCKNSNGYTVSFHESKNVLETEYRRGIYGSYGRRNNLQNSETPTSLCKIENGIYSFSNYMNCCMRTEVKRQERWAKHSSPRKFAVARCVIPKGSRYYVNRHATKFVSNALRVDGIVEYINCAS